MVEVEITDRARKWGYLIWKSSQDNDIASLLGADRVTIEVTFMDVARGMKKIDWKYRRISLGSNLTRNIPASNKIFTLKLSSPSKLEIHCR